MKNKTNLSGTTIPDSRARLSCLSDTSSPTSITNLTIPIRMAGKKNTENGKKQKKQGLRKIGIPVKFSFQRGCLFLNDLSAINDIDTLR